MKNNENLLMDRRSTWHFRDDTPTDEQFNALFEVGRFAPSAANGQPWQFVVIARSSHKQLWEELYNSLDEINLDWAATAPAFIITYTPKVADDLGRLLAWQDCGVSVLQLSLAAEQQGLDTHAIALFDRGRVGRAAGIGAEFDIPSMLAVGFRSAELDTKPVRKRKEIADIVQFGALRQDIAK